MDKKLIMGLNAHKLAFQLEEKGDTNTYSVLHLKIIISKQGIQILGDGIKDNFKAIDFRIRPSLENEVIDEIMAYLRDPEKKSESLWRQLFKSEK